MDEVTESGWYAFADMIKDRDAGWPRMKEYRARKAERLRRYMESMRNTPLDDRMRMQADAFNSRSQYDAYSPPQWWHSGPALVNSLGPGPGQRAKPSA